MSLLSQDQARVIFVMINQADAVRASFKMQFEDSNDPDGGVLRVTYRPATHSPLVIQRYVNDVCHGRNEWRDMIKFFEFHGL